MHTEEIEYLDGKFTVNGQDPDTLAELQSLGFSEADVVGGAVADLRYRNKYPRVYKKVSEDVVKLHNFPRKVESKKTKKDGTLSDVLESTNDHLRAALIGRRTNPDDKTSPAIPDSSLHDGEKILGDLFTAYDASEPLYVKGERSGLGGKVSEAALAAANGFFAEGEEKVDKIAAYIESKVPGYKLGRDAESLVTPESLARGISALNKHIAKEAAAAATAALGAVV